MPFIAQDRVHLSRGASHSKSHQVTSIGFELIHWALRKDTFLRLTTKTRKLRKG